MDDFINFYFIPGLVVGCTYALVAIGVSLIFGILRFANFCHGELMMIAGYFGHTLMVVTGWHPLIILPFAMAASAIVAVVIDQGFYKPFRNRPSIMLVMASFGTALMLRSLVQLVWGPESVSLASREIAPPIEFFGFLAVQSKHLVIIGAAFVLMVATHLLLTRTKMGKAMRAVSDSPELAKVTGIDTDRVIMTSWILSACLAAAAGVFVGMDTDVNSRLGFIYLLPGFAAAILGGIGSPYGAMLGGLVIGMAEELSAYPWIGDEPLLSPGYKSGVAFAIMIIMLIVRPQGLLKGKSF